MKYADAGLEIEYDVLFSRAGPNVVQLLGDFPIKEGGFILSRSEKKDGWDYTGYSTIYKEIEGGALFSNDGTVYMEPEKPEPDIPEPEPYIPTLDEIKESKVSELNADQQKAIAVGISVVLTDGTVEHFTLTDHDQTSLIGLQKRVESGDELIPWHTRNEDEHCKFYSNADMALITGKAMEYVTWHVTYFRDLRIFTRSLVEKEAVNAVFYGMNIPEEYQSEPLKAMIAAQTV